MKIQVKIDRDLKTRYYTIEVTDDCDVDVTAVVLAILGCGGG